MIGQRTTRLAILAAMMIVQAAHSGGGGGGPPEYEVDIIPGPFCGPFGYRPATGLGINDLGHICGRERDCNTDDEPFFWSPGTGRVELDIPPGFDEGRALDLNSTDQIVGWLRMNNVYHAALWQDEEVIELGIPPWGNFSEARAVNETAQVTGMWGNSALGPLHAFLWQGGVMLDLELPMGPNHAGNDVNSQGQITGWMGDAFFIDSHAFIWDDGKVTDLGVIPAGFTAEGMAINNQGDVAVQGRTFNDQNEVIVRSFLWRDGQWIDLGVLPGCEETRVLDLNDAGQAIGYCDGPVFHRFLWQDGAMWEINDLIQTNDPDFDAISLVWAINNAGQITGKGHHFELGSPAVRLNPILPTPGDLDGDGIVGVSDLLILLANWGPCDDCNDCPADLDGNCVVGVTDLLILLSNWG
ncbi:MAG: hypothetical protein V3W34_03480 [Phycisphaerae bacterium]